MTEYVLEEAMKQFVYSTRKIENLKAKLPALNEQYEHFVKSSMSSKGIMESFSVETAYKYYQEVENKQAEINTAIDELNKHKEIIMKYFKALQGRCNEILLDVREQQTQWRAIFKWETELTFTISN